MDTTQDAVKVSVDAPLPALEVKRDDRFYSQRLSVDGYECEFVRESAHKNRQFPVFGASM